jgi:hypothetical protein
LEASLKEARPLVRAVYPIAALLAVTPLFDLLTTVWPLQPESLMWRYGALGTVPNFLLTTLLAAVLASAAAAELRHLGTLRALSVLYLLAAVVQLAAVVLFALDVVQFRSQVTAEAVPNYMRTAGLAGAKYLIGVVMFAWLALAGLGTARNLRPGSASGMKDAQAPSRVLRSERAG